jgi:hypothetical protein
MYNILLKQTKYAKIPDYRKYENFLLAYSILKNLLTLTFNNGKKKLI